MRSNIQDIIREQVHKFTETATSFFLIGFLIMLTIGSLVGFQSQFNHLNGHLAHEDEDVREECCLYVRISYLSCLYCICISMRMISTLPGRDQYVMSEVNH